MPVTRRKLLQNSIRTAAKAFAAGGAIVAGHKLLQDRATTYPAKAGRAAGVRLVRPPGAVDEAAFLAGCIRCYRCQDACEPGAIQFFTVGEGKHYHTPYVDPAVKGCNLCMKCTKVCPTGVLKPMEVKEKDTAAMATVELREDLCLSYKAKRIRDEQAMLMELGREPTESGAVVERRGPCGECFMFCPLRNRAIKLEPGAFLAPIVFADACVGCGMCEEICRVMVRDEPAIRVVPTRKRV